MTVPSEDYFKNVTCALNDRTQWRLFQKRNVCIKWPYPM